jgi:hypothetical protein
MRSFPIAMVAAGCLLSLLACAGDGDAGGIGTGGTTGSGGALGGRGGGAGGATTAGRGGGPGGSTSGGAGTTAGGAGTTGTGGRAGSGSGSNGGAGGAAWDCLDVPGTLCICYARAGTDAPSCSPGFSCCFLLNATSCECFVAQEDCTSAAMQYPQVTSCPPP